MNDIKQRLMVQANPETYSAVKIHVTQLCQDALAEIERLETEKGKVDERLEYAEHDNDNHWTARTKMAIQLEQVLKILKEMRRAAGEDS